MTFRLNIGIFESNLTGKSRDFWRKMIIGSPTIWDGKDTGLSTADNGISGLKHMVHFSRKLFAKKSFNLF